MKKYASLMAGIPIVFLLTSCLKDKNIEDQKYGFTGVEDISVVEFTAPEFVAGVNAANKDTTIHLATVHLNAATPATQDIRVTLQRDDNAVTDAGYEILPADRYTLSPLTITIPKGSRDGYLDLKVNPSDLLDDHYAFAFVITAVDGGHHISVNFRTLLSELVVLNQYDGIYAARGVIENHPTVSGPFSREIPMETSSISSVWFTQPNRSGLFGVYIDVDVNADNTLTLTGSPSPYIPAGAQNYYDPATRTFYLNFKWAGAPDRQAKDTLAYVRPRF